MNLFWNLQTRERALVIGAAVVILLALLFLVVIDPQLTRSARLDRQIRAIQSQLRDTQTESHEYLRHKRVLDRINQQLTQQRTFSLFSRLEQLARQTGIPQFARPALCHPPLPRRDRMDHFVQPIGRMAEQLGRSPTL